MVRVVARLLIAVYVMFWALLLGSEHVRHDLEDLWAQYAENNN